MRDPGDVVKNSLTALAAPQSGGRLLRVSKSGLPCKDADRFVVRPQKPHFLERASVVMVDHESGLTRAPADNLEHHSLEFKDTHDQKTS